MKRNREDTQKREERGLRTQLESPRAALREGDRLKLTQLVTGGKRGEESTLTLLGQCRNT